MTRFDVSHAEWHPYWEPRPLVTTGSDSVKASLYLAGKAGHRSALVVVSNLSTTDESAAALTLDLQRLGLRETGLKARNALTNEALTLQGNRLTLPIPQMRMRMVWIE
jgi:hypothetical protein